MRTLAILLLLCTEAFAQSCGPANPNCIVPTAPPGTNDNRAASTAFVENAVAGGGGGTLLPLNNTWTGINTYNNAIIINGGTLAPGATALSVTATQPANPSAAQFAILYNVTSAGNANQTNIGWVFNYLPGYTGIANTNALNISNNAASTANTLNGGPGVNPISGNIGTSSNTFGTTTGLNVGDRAIASNGQTNVGYVGLANVAGGAGTANLGAVGSAFNNGGGAMIGGYFNLAQTVTPTVQAALVADNGVQAAPIALFRNNGATVASVTQTGGLTGTLPASAGAGGLFVCVDTAGVMYKKATCP